MQVRLRVLQGSNAGKEVKVPVSEFIIGRKEGCHLRPRSDMISRKHCALIVNEKDSVLIVRDLKSRNGTFVNGERIEGERELSAGDLLKLGKLEFQVVIDHSLGGSKKPKVESVKEVAARTAGTADDQGAGDDDDVSDWLKDGDEEQGAQDPDTRQFKLDETDRIALEQQVDSSDVKDGGDVRTDTLSGSDEDTADDTTIDKKKKKQPGKLPKQTMQTKDSKEAAAQVLKDFFNRR